MQNKTASENCCFLAYLNQCNQTGLVDYLNSLQNPVWECELMHVAFPESDLVTGSALEMYHWHFVLFHVLYKLVPVYALNNRYLYIHFMRTCIRDYPADGQCRHFDAELTIFCAAPCTDNSQFCEFHHARNDETAIDLLSDRYFYLDPANFSALSAETAEKFISGTWKLLQNQNEYRKCLEIMGLPAGVSVDIIKKRFRYLARTMHPDITAGHHAEFARINTAYRSLLNWMSAG